MNTDSVHYETKTTMAKFFRCPVEHCGKRIYESPRQIAEHIKKTHPTISKKMGLCATPSRNVFICKPCNSYTTRIHHHCYECEHPENGGKSRYFLSVEERDEHLKRDHAKWWLEYECKFGSECRGKKGGCGFNHNKFVQPFITDITDIPSCVCRYDCPWSGQRCLRDKCSFSHFWGRVRFLIKSRAVQSEHEKPDMLAAPDTDCVCVHGYEHVHEPAHEPELLATPDN